ncbi:DUF4743 domain-containing protein [Pelomonas sp. SE-A7]|uniref:NUDIX hydrolase n=1 Tax=Pelomonas sp. SE-A7 TaxID=3054953 RepID=UPI00259CCDF4|nr:DUF4743 domain-containing protein [Pelomonas sp. SE-A7]MDM4764721.1 DUF4743 domain-containing protein [Pelomonas sp. SE-A7]
MIPEHRLRLQRQLAGICQPLPDGGQRLLLDGRPLGWLDQRRAVVLRELWPALILDEEGLQWRSRGRTAAELSAEIGAVAQSLQALGEITGWRNELYRCEADARGAARGRALFRLERSAFRFFGLRSRAVHVNGWSLQGQLLCGRRALSKATDPGALDNLAAGGLGADEAPLACARRELWEEAGLPLSQRVGLSWRGLVHARRVEAGGLHDELLHVYSLELPAGFQPVNRDGEVSNFLALKPDEVVARLGEFSPDAAAVSSLELLLGA